MKEQLTNKPMVTIQNFSTTKNIPSKKQFKNWIKCCPIKKPHEIVISIVNTRKMIALNKTYRRKNKPTNIISFKFLAPPNIKTTILGDLVICAPIVKREAKEQGKSMLAHWAHLTIHGTLHLLGYDHKTNKAAQSMEKLEIKILKQLGFTDPYNQG